jgi:mRNA-degrading endonuclease RelE of RelBE toxin-antitoxin system
MKIIQSPLFARTIKKFNKNEKKILDTEIRSIVDNPLIGQQKKGDLKNIFVYKFKIEDRQFLLSYRHSKDLLELITIGSHENYYRELKSYLKK